MSREIKFRAWDKLEKRFTYSNKGYQGHYVMSLDGKFSNLQNGTGGDEYEVQQFTGMKDKNGKNIYEGDVVSFPPDLYKTENELCVVVWETPSWMYRDVPRVVSPIDRLPFSFLGEKDHMAEVIGNIFENPELLK